jgi:hypothetical protein
VYLFRQNLNFLAEAQPSQFSSLQYKNSQLSWKNQQHVMFIFMGLHVRYFSNENLIFFPSST